ncbi:MAG TPA: transglutaminase domain-containing protein, partial [Bacteroidia bacterium]|nr:transglutaminase domain-containing protein [Bacteroidia bacterium]
MNIKIHLLAALLLLTSFSSAQNKLPLIYANSANVDILEGGKLKKEAWVISPDVKPDIYITEIPNSTITFYTDIDSISFNVKPNGVYDFIIVLNQKDSAYTQIKYHDSNLAVLKTSGSYSNKPYPNIPPFTYLDSSDINLKALRKAFNLDSIAGTGNDANRIINLMHWIHYLVPHDGQHDNPVIRNAMSMIKECKAGNRGLNCRGLATVLNECYLSLGIKSRFVTCMPKDTNDTECHVINMVFANDLNKWIWIDPTNDAYIMNENGDLLSIQEVRERLIAGKTVIVNPDANWNRRGTAIKEEYLLNYMAKNLFWFDCPINSKYDTET